MRFRHAVSIVTAFVECLLFAGAIFGWPSLQYVLTEAGYFAYKCANSTDRNATTDDVMAGHALCDEQEKSFNLVFTVSAALLYLSAAPVNYVLDRYGTFAYRTGITLVFSASYVALVFSAPDTSWVLYPFAVCLAVSGLAMFTSNVQLANLSQSYRAVIISAFSGFVDSSAIVFFLVKIAFDAGVGVRTLFVVLAASSVVPWFRTFVLMPRYLVSFPLERPAVGYVCCGESDHDSTTSEDATEKMVAADGTIVTGGKSDDETSQQQQQPSAADCMKQSIFWSNVALFGISSLRSDFFFGSLNSWLTRMEHRHGVSHVLNVFGVLSFFGVAASPVSGVVADGVVRLLRKSGLTRTQQNLRAQAATMFATSSATTLLSAAVLVPHPYAAFVLVMMSKGMMYASCCAFVAIMFPSRHFGKLYGVTATAGGVVAFLQYPLFKLAVETDSFRQVNWLMLALSLLTYSHSALLFVKGCSGAGRVRIE